MQSFIPYKGDDWRELERFHYTNPEELPPNSPLRLKKKVFQDKLYEVETLEDSLRSHMGKDFTQDQISAIRRAFEDLGIENVEQSHVEQFMEKLPNIENLEDQVDIFAVLAFLGKKKEFRQIIASYGLLEKVDYSMLPHLHPDIQREICTAARYAITDENVQDMYEALMPSLIQVANDFYRYERSDLESVLDLAAAFIPVIPYGSNDKIAVLLPFFMLFIEHPEGNICCAAVQAVTAVLHYHRYMIAPDSPTRSVEFTDPQRVAQLADRLAFIGSWDNDDLCESVVHLMTHLLRDSQHFPPEFYSFINRMIHTNLPLSDRKSRKFIIFLLNNAITVPAFRDLEDVDELVHLLVDEYDSMKIPEKKECVSVFANVLYCMGPEYASECLNSDEFMDCFFDVMELAADTGEDFDALMTGLAYVLVRHHCVIESPETQGRLCELISNMNEQALEVETLSNTRRCCELVMKALGAD